MHLTGPIFLALFVSVGFAGSACGERVSAKTVDHCIANLKAEKLKPRGPHLLSLHGEGSRRGGHAVV
jgi:hypothetical protein